MSLFLIQTIHYVIVPDPNHALCHCSWSKPYSVTARDLNHTNYYAIVPDQNCISTSRLLLTQSIHYVTASDPNHNYTMSLALIQNHKVCHWPLIQTIYYAIAPVLNN